MSAFALEHPIVFLLIILAALGTVRAIVPWVRRDRGGED